MSISWYNNEKHRDELAWIDTEKRIPRRSVSGTSRMVRVMGKETGIEIRALKSAGRGWVYKLRCVLCWNEWDIRDHSCFHKSLSSFQLSKG
jgi:hypothetical protein